MLQPAKTSPFPTIHEIWEQTRPELLKVEKEIEKSLASEVPLINEVGQYLLNSGGKRIRPLLMILCSGICPSPDNRHIELAAVIEFIHTATLLHDDVIDEGSIRRGKKTARHLWGNRASILAGDFLYANAMAKGLSLNNHDVNDALQRACCRMIEGEMSQHIHHMDPEILESVYIHIIENKTASLMEATCSLAGIVSGASPEQKKALQNFGLYLGIAFQVADDTLDYTATEARLGKPLGADLKEGKVTLPLIHLFKNSSPEEKKLLLGLLGSDSVPEDNLARVLELMRSHGSLDYTFSAAREYVEKAKKFLDSFESSFNKSALFAVADYVVTRDH